MVNENYIPISPFLSGAIGTAIGEFENRNGVAPLAAPGAGCSGNCTGVSCQTTCSGSCSGVQC